jgi:uncharacterized short protein YbdD (DUF466 family)
LFSKYEKIFQQNEEIASASNNRVGTKLFYRGQACAGWRLEPNVFRNGLLKYEHYLIKEMRQKNTDAFRGMDKLDSLMIMQHYGLPTRLLDVTMNPLVALFFACREKHDKDGRIFTFCDHLSGRGNFIVECMVALAEYKGSSYKELCDFLTQFQCDSASSIEIETIYSLIAGPYAYLPIEVSANNERNERMQQQEGAFVIFGLNDSGEGTKPYLKAEFCSLEPFVKNVADQLGIQTSILIPKDEKEELFKELDTKGINEQHLFPPDDPKHSELECQATCIKKKYEAQARSSPKRCCDG